MMEAKIDSSTSQQDIVHPGLRRRPTAWFNSVLPTVSVDDGMGAQDL